MGCGGGGGGAQLAPSLFASGGVGVSRLPWAIFLAWLPAETLLGLSVGLLVAGVYHLLYWGRRRRGVYPIPFGAIFGYMVLLWLAPVEARLAALLVALVVGLRGLQILLGRW